MVPGKLPTGQLPTGQQPLRSIVVIGFCSQHTLSFSMHAKAAQHDCSVLCLARFMT